MLQIPPSQIMQKSDTIKIYTPWITHTCTHPIKPTNVIGVEKDPDVSYTTVHDKDFKIYIGEKTAPSTNLAGKTELQHTKKKRQKESRLYKTS